MDFMAKILEQAAVLKKTIVLPESNDDRIIIAAKRITDQGIAKIILLGPEKEIMQRMARLEVSPEGVEIIDPSEFPQRASYSEKLYELRKEKGLTKDEADKLILSPLYLSTMLVNEGYADGSVAGAASATGDVLRPALQIIRTAPGVSLVSGAFFMLLDSEYLEEGIVAMADCAVNPNPDARQLAEIGIATAKSTKIVAGLEPRVAFLSFSTLGSAKHEFVDKVRQAKEIAQSLEPGFDFEGEIQADAALVPSIGSLKAPNSKIAGRANVLVFPDLQSANIGYKLVQRLAGAEAIGPILQGIAKPINDLSRGCSVEDIINLVAITVLQAG